MAKKPNEQSDTVISDTEASGQGLLAAQQNQLTAMAQPLTEGTIAGAKPAQFTGEIQEEVAQLTGQPPQGRPMAVLGQPQHLADNAAPEGRPRATGGTFMSEPRPRDTETMGGYTGSGTYSSTPVQSPGRPVTTASEIFQPHVPQFNVKVNGAQCPGELMLDVLECTVENSLHLPDHCVLRIHDNEFKWLDSHFFQEGHRLQVEGGEGQHELKPIFDGEIVGIEPEMASHDSSSLTIRCLDKSHRLHRGRHARTFANVKDSDLVHKLGKEMGLHVKAEPTKVVHDWVVQNNQSNWEFLQERAARNGYRLYVKGHKDLVFEKVKDKGHATVELEWGKQLLSFRPRTSTAHQVAEVEVRGWDPKTKKAIVEKVSAPQGIPKTGRPAKGGELAQKAFGKAKHVIVDRPIHSHAEAKELAQSVHDELSGAFLEAEGQCVAMPTLKPGMTVKIPNIGKRFSGEYHVSATTHVYSPAEGFTTTFTVSGKHPQSLLKSPSTTVADQSPVGGNFVTAIVTDNNDPQKLGRVKVKYPWLTEDHNSFWARQSSQMGGPGRGMFNIPEIGDEVLVAFEHGEMSRPFVVGQLWNGEDKVPSASGNPVLGPGGEVNRRGFHSRIGHQVNFDDTGGKGSMQMKSSGNHVMNVDDANKCIDITTTANHKVNISDQEKSIGLTSTNMHSVKIDDMSNSITMMTTGTQLANLTDSGGLVLLKDVTGDTLMMTNGMVNLLGTMMVTLAAPVVNINAQIAANLAGLTVNVAAGALATFTTGKVVQIAGGALVDVKGAAIRFNQPPGAQDDDDDDDDDTDSDGGDGGGDSGSGGGGGDDSSVTQTPLDDEDGGHGDGMDGDEANEPGNPDEDDRRTGVDGSDTNTPTFEDPEKEQQLADYIDSSGVKEKWDSMSDDEKVQALQDIHNKQAEIFGFAPVPVTAAEANAAKDGWFSPSKNEIFMNKDAVELAWPVYSWNDPDETIKTLMHEGRHVQQGQAANDWASTANQSSVDPGFGEQMAESHRTMDRTPYAEREHEIDAEAFAKRVSEDELPED